jgi:hypothetical protein
MQAARETTTSLISNSINVLSEMLEGRCINHRLCHARAADLNHYDFFLRGNLKNKVHVCNPHTLYELKSINNIGRPASVKVSEMT